MKKFKTRHKKKQKIGGDMIEIGDDPKKMTTDRNPLTNNRNLKCIKYDAWGQVLVGTRSMCYSTCQNILMSMVKLDVAHLLPNSSDLDDKS